MEDDAVAGYFKGAVRQFEQQIGDETAEYLLATYDMGEHKIALTALISNLVELGYDEQQLLQGPLSRIAQALNVSIDEALSVAPDQSAIPLPPDQRPDPFAKSVETLRQQLGASPTPPAQPAPQQDTATLPAPVPPQPGQSIQPSVEQDNDSHTVHLH